MGEEHPNHRAGVARTEAAWRDLLAAIAAVPAESLRRPGIVGDWSVKDLLGHVAVWDEEAATKLRRIGAGLPVEEFSFQALNESEADARAVWTVAEAMEAMQRAHALLAATLDAHPEIDPDDVKVDTWEHYAEHAEQIRAWRG